MGDTLGHLRLGAQLWIQRLRQLGEFAVAFHLPELRFRFEKPSCRSERVNLNDLFERMTGKELEDYAKEGKLPDWFTSVVGATGRHTPNEGSL